MAYKTSSWVFILHTKKCTQFSTNEELFLSQTRENDCFSDLSAGKCLTDGVFAYCMKPLLNRACGPRASCMCLALSKRYSPSNPSHHTALGYGLPIFLPIFSCV